MKKFLPILKQTALFTGVDDQEVLSMLSCLGTAVKSFGKGEYVFRQGDRPTSITVLASGCLHVQHEDYWGNRSIIQSIAVGEMFGETYAAPDSGALQCDVVAACDSTVLFFDLSRVLTVCPSACRFHTMVVKNLFFAISEKNRRLVQKLGHMSRRSTREKLLSYLSEEAAKSGSSSFTIPFDRQQLADYLSVERSAMSNELSKMRSDGILDFNKNHFTLL